MSRADAALVLKKHGHDLKGFSYLTTFGADHYLVKELTLYKVDNVLCSVDTAETTNAVVKAIHQWLTNANLELAMGALERVRGSDDATHQKRAETSERAAQALLIEAFTGTPVCTCHFAPLPNYKTETVKWV